MARPKKVKSKGDAIAPKAKGLFDHLNHIREVQNPHYFDTLTEADKKSWTNYMICRFLSMQPDLIEYMNEFQKYDNILEPRDFYRLIISVVPKRRAYYPYIKNTDKRWSKQVLRLLREHFQESERNVREYLELLTPEELRQIVAKYGFSEKEVEKILDPENKVDFID